MLNLVFKVQYLRAKRNKNEANTLWENKNKSGFYVYTNVTLPFTFWTLKMNKEHAHLIVEIFPSIQNSNFFPHLKYHTFST